jgi:hypothetical protein
LLVALALFMPFSFREGRYKQKKGRVRHRSRRTIRTRPHSIGMPFLPSVLLGYTRPPCVGGLRKPTERIGERADNR